MASRVGKVVQESSFSWKNNGVSKGPRKGVLGGRKPLGDLSNSLEPSSNQASKKHNSSTNEGSKTSRNKKSINAQAPKKLQPPSGRKPLSDISNSGKPNLKGGFKNYGIGKLSVLAEEPIDANEIAGEQCLHDHQQCIKAQSKTMDLDLFLQTIGLDNDLPNEQATSMPYQSPSRLFPLEEMPEELMVLKHKFSSELDSPSPLRSPKYYVDYDCKLELLRSPESA